MKKEKKEEKIVDKIEIIKPENTEQKLEPKVEEIEPKTTEVQPVLTIPELSTAAGQNEVQNSVVTPIVAPKQSGWAKFAFVLSILSFIGMILGVFTTFSFLFVMLYYFVLIIFAMMTLFLILLNEEFRSYLQGGDTLADISMQLMEVGKYINIGVMAMSVVSIVLLSIFKKYPNRVGGLVISILALIGAVVAFVVPYVVEVQF